MKTRKYLWEILVPNSYKRKKILLAKHHIWDKKVRSISGGLTIFKTAKGTWENSLGKIFIEPMIPVRIMCNPEQIRKIADLTAKHYRQEAVMYYRVSNQVVVRHYHTSKRPD